MINVSDLMDRLNSKIPKESRYTFNKVEVRNGRIEIEVTEKPSTFGCSFSVDIYQDYTDEVLDQIADRTVRKMEDMIYPDKSKIELLKLHLSYYVPELAELYETNDW